jgi:hypothetical protein
MKAPKFKNKEVVVRIPETITLTDQKMAKEVVGEVVYKGELGLKYEVGMKVLFDQEKSVLVKYFKEPMWKIVHEDFVICEVIDVD